MPWYAETPLRRSCQVIGDLLVLVWVLGWVLIGRGVHALVSTLAAPAAPLRDAGTGWRGRMEDLAGRIVDVPLVGDDLDDPVLGAAGVGDDLVAAGDRLESSVDQVAWLLSLLTAGTPIVLVLGGYLTLRWLGIRRSSAVAVLREEPGAQQLLALRALVHQSPRTLQQVGTDPVAAWRADDPAVVAALADLELRRRGLRARQATG